MSARLLLGVDGGGTRTTAWLADEAGNVLGKGVAGPSNAKAIGNELAWANLQQAHHEARKNAALSDLPSEIACYGLAGFDRPEDKQLLDRWVSGWAKRSLYVNDGDLVLAAGTPEGWGVGVIAGTGSIAVGRAADGRTARAGGWGPLFGDEGSGYAVALAGLRKVARRWDGRESLSATDALTDRLSEALGIDTPAQLVAAIYGTARDRRTIAALAPTVVSASHDDPEVLREIVEPAAQQLAEMVAAAARRLGWEQGPLPLAMAGGFLLGADVVAEMLLQRLEGIGFRVTGCRVTEPVRGALTLARRALTT